MAVIDIILGSILLYGLIKGLWKGLFTELAGLISLLAGIFIAIKFSGFTGSILEGHVSWEPKYISITAFAITFIAVVAAIIVLGKVFTKLAGFAGLGIFNRIFGGVFGFLKMVLILSVSLNFFLKLNSNNSFAEKETLDNSVLFYPVLEVSNILFPVLEEWFAEFKTDEADSPETNAELNHSV